VSRWHVDGMGTRRVFLWIGCVGVLVAGPAWAEEGCGKLFPDFTSDFTCERSARPKGSVMPMSFPYLFEDPYITSGLNFVGIWHQFPHDSVFEGGQLGVLALQVRLAITERLAFIAAKDGIAILDADNELIQNDTGFLDLGFGFKYAAWEWNGQDDQSVVLTPSLRYEAPSGQQKVFSGDGDGLLIPAISGAYHAGPWNVVADLGGNAALDSDKNSSNVFYNIHVDHAFASPIAHEWVKFIVPFIELNGIYWASAGDGSRKVNLKGLPSLPIGAVKPNFEGADVVNLGNNDVSGSNYVTMAWGVRFPMAAGFDIGASYERPLSDRKDITEQRVTLNITWEM